MADQVQQSPEDDGLLKVVTNALSLAEPYHQRWRKKANHYWALYRNLNDARAAYASSSTERGRDAVHNDAKKTFGAEFFIPMAFSTVETVVPKVLASRPRMKAEPRNIPAEANIANAEALIDLQQDQMNYELKLQEIAKDAMITGLGAQKIMWKSEYRKRNRLVPSAQTATANPSGVTTAQVLEKIYDDPDALAVDPFDLIWDPFGFDIESCEFVIHRTWRSNAYVLKQFELFQASGGGQGWRNLDPQAIGRMNSIQKYDEIWKDRLKAGSMGDVQRAGDKKLHEVLEFHDGDQVIKILDRQAVVQSGPNPFWHGEKPFQIYRPTHVPHQIPGIGEIEPIEDLQEEMNTLRRQRRDNASFVLDRVVAYAEGMVEQGDIQFFPGAAIPIQGGVDPREVVFPLPQQDIPYSSFQEEDRIRSDTDRTTGLSDPVMGVAQTGQTATAAQLVFQAVTERVKNKTTRLEIEIINPGTRQMFELDQQKILSPRDIPIPVGPPQIQLMPAADGTFSFQNADPERRWNWIKLGPLELAGNFAWKADASTTPENVPQQRSDAEALITGGQDNPNVDQRKLMVKWLELNGIKNPESYLAAPKPDVPPETLDILASMGVDQNMISQALQEALTGKAPPSPSQSQTNGAPSAAPAPQGGQSQ